MPGSLRMFRHVSSGGPDPRGATAQEALHIERLGRGVLTRHGVGVARSSVVLLDALAPEYGDYVEQLMHRYRGFMLDDGGGGAMKSYSDLAGDSLHDGIVVGPGTEHMVAR